MSFFGAAVGLGSALIGSSSANKAAKAQTAAAEADRVMQMRMWRQTRKDFRPYRETGTNALAAYNYLNGIGPRPEDYVDFTGTPGYQFRVNQGNDSINAMAGARGGLNSGRTLQDLATFNQNIASDEFGNYANRLGGLVDTGMGAAGMTGTANQNAAAGVSNALSGIGNAQSAGAIGVGNALNNGLQTGLGIWQYQQGLQGQPGGNAGIGSTPWAAPGFWG